MLPGRVVGAERVLRTPLGTVPDELVGVRTGPTRIAISITLKRRNIALFVLPLRPDLPQPERRQTRDERLVLLLLALLPALPRLS